MKNLTVISLLLFAIHLRLNAQSDLKWSAVLQQATMFYSSRQISSAGAGMGTGLACTWRKNLTGQADANLYWLNGNAFSIRLALGIQKPGKWSPAVFAGCSMIGGSHTEIILSDGKRPASPVFVPELRLAPLRFRNDRGFVSMLEFGAGFGADNGVLLQMSVIKLGANFR